MTLYIEDLDNDDIEHIVYKAAEILLNKNGDRYLHNAPANAIEKTIKSLSENAHVIFDMSDSYQFDIDTNNDKNIEDLCINYMIDKVQKTLIRMFINDIIYIINHGNVSSEVEFVTKEGDLVLFESENYAVVVSNTGFNSQLEIR